MVWVLPTASEEGIRHLQLGCLLPRARQGQHFTLNVAQLLPVGNIHDFSCSTFHLTAASALPVVEDSFFLIRTHRQQYNYSLLNIQSFSHFIDFSEGLQCSHSKTSN